MVILVTVLDKIFAPEASADISRVFVEVRVKVVDPDDNLNLNSKVGTSPWQNSCGSKEPLTLISSNSNNYCLFIIKLYSVSFKYNSNNYEWWNYLILVLNYN